MVRNNIIFELYSFLLSCDSVSLSNVGFCVCSNCHPLFICLWCWWTIKKGAFPGFLEGAASLFPSPAGPGVSAASHLQPVPSLGRGMLHMSTWAQPLSSRMSLATTCQCSSAPGGEPRLRCVCLSPSFPSSPPCRHRLWESVLPQLLCRLLQFPAELQAHPGLHSHWLGPWHPSGPLQILAASN